ncbi:MAG: FAD-binding protein [Alphaproteobacteria bacterium]|nr:FAD-binding protein [Alphaproteobacteria bacterium]
MAVTVQTEPREATGATQGHNSGDGGDAIDRDAAIAELKARLGDQVSTAEAVRDHHSRGASYHEGPLPDAVVFARSTEEVAEAVKICAKHKMPVIPFGTGSSLEGHVIALNGGVSIDVTQMNRILEVNAEDLDVRVEAGVTRKQLNEDLRDTGLFFPIDPGADASIGGMAATRASGTNAVRYGTMRENVLSLTVVTATGEIIRTARRSRKSSAGYDLTRLFVGSEGTLGVITEVTLKLAGIPEAISSAVCAFPSVDDAVNAVILTIQSGVPVARIELLDDVQMGACIEYSGLERYSAAPTLFFEFHGTEAGVVEQAETVRAIAADFGGTDFQWTTKAEERNALWQARHDAYWAALALKPGSKGWATDVCVPISRLAECIAETRKDLDELGLVAPLVGHVGDGNFHLVYLLDPNKPEDFERAKDHNGRMVRRALAMDGTITGEHGVGYGKMGYLAAEHGGAVDLMRQVKRALDPDNIMNPGKIVEV